MTDDLIEELAIRLFRAGYWPEGSPRPSKPPDERYMPSARRMAREALRHMEWARRNECKRNLGLVFATDEFPPLTLPPDDWQPEN